MIQKNALVRLNDKQASFIEAIESGNDPRAAARIAGYANPTQDANRLLRAPAVQFALELSLRRKLHGELAPLAFQVIERILRNDEGNFGERVQLDAAKLALDRAGFVPLKGEAQAGEREPEQMTTGELHQLVERLERELGQRAAPVGEPTPAKGAEG